MKGAASVDSGYLRPSQHYQTTFEEVVRLDLVDPAGANHLLSSKDGGRRYQLLDTVLLKAGDLLVCRRLPSCRLGKTHSLLESARDLQFVSLLRMVSSGGGGDVSILCKERRILEVISNVLHLYVGVENERVQVVQCTILEKCRQAGGTTACLSARRYTCRARSRKRKFAAWHLTCGATRSCI